MNKPILFVSHKKSQCGVWEFGKNITDALQHSKRYQFIRVECSSLDELQAAISENAPAAIIYNYSSLVFPWIGSDLYRRKIVSLVCPQIGIIHDINQHIADMATTYEAGFMPDASSLMNSIFDFYIASDPTILLRNPFVYKTGRLIPSYQNDFPIPLKPTIGSFGFGCGDKGFERITQLVQREFDEAVIRFNIPAADYGDSEGISARAIAERCRTQVTKPGIRLTITHDYLDIKGLLDFLAQNTVNVFLYEGGRGMSSVIDVAMAAQRPVAVSDNPAFRHLFDVEPSVRVTKNNLKTIIQNGFAPLQKHYNEWSPENIMREYEEILDTIFTKWKMI